HWIAVVPHEAAFGEHQWSLAGLQLAQQAAHQLFRVAEPIDGRRVDPVDPTLDGMAHGRERRGVVLRAPAERPAAAPDRPGAEADGRDIESARAEWTGWQSHKLPLRLRESARVWRSSCAHRVPDETRRRSPGCTRGSVDG